ncbi:MAG: beta-ketoacyl-[acyl-carrier-protein] synthase family protein [Sorangiineae bacterium]|nr:beta-ketoacyl-[acyl-carrier-protein] synthase family protein [Polyangiaceae bacterium]MEB2322069.1 beta-ketoacyl-[acyl-carrier-protein] synthase family protein [Sorangiineae bacterium]
MAPERRVVVTGLGVLAPNGHGLEAFERALRAGESGIRFQPELAALNFGCQVGGIPQGVEEIQRGYLSEDELYAMNPNMIYAAIAAIDAWNDAGLARVSPEDEPDWGTGAVLGTGIGGIDTIAEKLAPKTEAGKVGRLGSAMVEQIMSSGNSARVAGLLGLGNQVTTNSSACNTGTEAIVQAFARIRAGQAERMLAGGSEGHSKYIWAGFDAMKVLNRTKNDAPAEASRPLSASAAGFIPGSGAGVLMLESLESALGRGARIWAEVLGGAVNCGGHRQGGSMTAPNPVGVQRCIRGAIATAGIDASDIDLINGHLTATFADPHEVENWRAALGVEPERLPLIQSTKSLIGHALGAAGGIECVASVLELAKGFVHGSLNSEDLHPALTAYAGRIVHETRDDPGLSVVAKASFGFGDVNGCVIFRKYRG